jgi:hypothetical protein
MFSDGERTALAAVPALCRAALEFAAQGVQSGPDAMKGLIGAPGALAIVRAAGLDAVGIEARWAAAAPARQQQPHQSSVFDVDLRHDRRVMDAQLRGQPGAVCEALAEVAADEAAPGVLRDKALKASQLIAGGMSISEAMDQADVIVAVGRWERHGGASAALGVSADQFGKPRQRSVIHRDVAELGAERD